MLKGRAGERFRLVTQPDHAEASGYLAAHWGNGEFQRPGHWEQSKEPDAVRQEIVFGIAQHDNGWWEWEADPEIDPADGLPLDFLQGSEAAGFERWRRGAARFERNHPLASLLISRHAYWLQTARVADIREPQFQHPLFGFRPRKSDPDSPEAGALREFLVERLSHERALLDRLGIGGGIWERAAHDATLLPAVRLLQVLDTVSLTLCGGAAKSLKLLEVPRQSWSDRVTLEVAPAGGERIAMTPYPFGLDPLPVFIPATFVSAGSWPATEPKTMLRFELASS